MQILIDDRPYTPTQPQPSDQTLQQLAGEICGNSSRPDARLVVSLACDGNPVQPAELDDFLKRPVTSFQSIELQTVSVRDQVAATVSQALEVVQSSDEVREQVADDLNQGRHESAMAGLQKLLEIFKQVQQTTLLSSELLGLPLESIAPDGKDLTSILATVKDQLGELKAGMESQDFVLVADILRYQFPEPLAAWAGILEALQARAGER